MMRQRVISAGSWAVTLFIKEYVAHTVAISNVEWLPDALP